MNKLTRLLSMATLSLCTLHVNADTLQDAVQDEHRSAAAKARDEYRNPQQTLRFFGIEPNMTVVEIWPGGGWYTDILAPLLDKDGQLIAAHFYVEDGDDNYYSRSLAKFKQKVSEHKPYNNIQVSAFHPTKDTAIAAPGTADAVLTFRNVHNWYMRGGMEGVNQSFETFFKALKKGGVLGVVDHRLPESASDEEQKKSGYMKQSVIVKAAEAAGFKLAASSEINANPLDTAQHEKGVWTLPPRLALDDKDKAKYLAIGESDRMTLKFVKP